MESSGRYQRLITMAAIVIVVAALYLAKGVLMPFALAMMVSFLLAPLVLRLQRLHFNRVSAVVSVALLVFLGTSAVSWLVVGQVRDVTTKVSEYKQNIQEKLGALRGMVAKPVQSALDTVQALGADPAPAADAAAGAMPLQTVRISDPPRGPLELLRDAAGPTLDSLMTGAMALLFAFVMLLRRDDLGDRFIRIVGHGKVLVTTRALEEAAAKVSSYLWRFLLLNSMHGVAVGLGLLAIGVPNALLWGLLSGLLRFIPYIGPWIAATFPVLTALAVFPGWTQPLCVVGLFALLELVSNNVLEPWIYSSGTGLSPLATVAAALFWTWLWGPVGLLLSIPLTVCLVVLGKHVPQLYFLHLLFGDSPGLTPPSRLYQRLIAGDQDQAWLVIQTELAQRALADLYDSVMLPALALAERDRKRGALDDEAQARIEETLRLLLEETGELSPAADPVRADALRVLCLPARGAADALAATMLQHVLERDGVHVEIASATELASETLDLFASRHVDVVCISAVPPSRFMHVRYLCKRIAARFPELPIIAGIWTLELDETQPDGRPPMPGNTRIATSLEEARSMVHQSAQSAQILHALEPDALPVASA